METTDASMVDDIKLRSAQLKAAESGSIFEDLGPIYDCVVFHDGERWQAVIDTSETGDMSTAEPMTDYRYARQYRTFSEIDSLNYCVEILDEGSILSIVVDAGAHGTHVAGIVAAYHPDQPECNGIAPGAQIVSLKIGDSRLGSMETGVGLMRALIEAVKRGCHIINMSFGEATAWDNYGEFIRLADKLVHEHGIVFVSSAGNNGPALSTVGCPGGTSSSVIGVGAFVTQSLMSVAYAYSQILPETNYTWSSVGPTIDGDLGVSIMAPGGAVTCVPNWTLNKKQLMNGTSMSSPNACGCITLLLSAAKVNAIPVSPMRIRRAVENGALLIEDVSVLGQGFGLVQVPAAYRLLTSMASANPQWADILITINLQSERFNRGIYLRQHYETSNASTYVASIEPFFKEKTPPAVKVNFEVRVKLECSASWFRCNEHIILLASGKQLTIFVDPTGLTEGVHAEFVRGYDEDNYQLGPMFVIPVVVVKPEVVTATHYSLGQLSLAPNERYRRFIVPPKGTQYVDAIIRDTRQSGTASPSNDALQHQAPTHENLASVSSVRFNPHPSVLGEVKRQGSETETLDSFSMINETVKATQAGTSIAESVIEYTSPDISPSLIVVHALQLFRGTPYRDNEKDSYVTLRPGSEHCLSWAVTDGWAMEFTVARSWSNIVDPNFEVTLHFRGVEPVPAQVLITGGQRVSEKITVFSKLCTFPIDISPSAKLDRWTTMIKPSSAGKVAPLGERDVLPDGTRLYQLVLEYEIEHTEANDAVPRWPGLQGVLYESDFHAQFFMLYDAQKKLVASGDAWPSFAKVAKGKYTLRLQVRHASVGVLEGLAEMPVQWERKIAGISLNFFKTQSEALVGKDKMGTRALIKDGAVSMYIREPSHEQLPKGAATGDVLSGSITYIKKNDNTLGQGNRPGGYPIRYVVNDTKPLVSKTSGNCNNGAKVSPTNSSEELSGLDGAVKDAKLKYLKSLCGKSDPTFSEMTDKLMLEYPGNLTIYQTVLTYFVQLRSKHFDKVTLDDSKDVYRALAASASFTTFLPLLDQVATAADGLLSLIDVGAIAQEFGTNAPDKEDAVATAARKELENKKGMLVEALAAKAFVALDRLRLDEVSNSSVPNHGSNEADPSTAVDSNDPPQPTDGDVAATATISAKDMFLNAYQQLARWDDISADKYWQLSVEKLKLNGKLGGAIKRVHDLITALESNKIKDLDRRVFLHGVSFTIYLSI